MAKKQKEQYVDGYVLAIPKKNVARYRKMAKEAGKLWKKYGALNVKECMGDDLRPDVGGYPILRFPKLMKLKKNETLWFSYITYKSKSHRNAVNKRVEKEMSKTYKDNPKNIESMPFSMKRMAFGGFKVMVDE